MTFEILSQYLRPDFLPSFIHFQTKNVSPVLIGFSQSGSVLFSGGT